MKIYTKEEIDRARDYLESEGFQKIEAELEDVSFVYYEVPQSLNEELPDFVMRMTGSSPDDGKLYGISKSVRKELRPYAVAHEVIEFGHLGIDHPDRCIFALDRELAIVPLNMFNEYVDMRMRFFERLIPYAKSNPEHYDSDDVRQFEANYRKLRDLATRD